MNDTAADQSSLDANDHRLGSAAGEPDPYDLAKDAATQNLLLMTPMFVTLFYIPMAVATIPGEVRMYARIAKRGRPNISELVFWFLKYIYLAHVLCFTLTMWAGPGYVTASSCFNMWWFSKWATYSAATLVTLTCAIRAYVILGRQRKLGIAFLAGLFAHYGMGMGLAVTDVNMDMYWGGYCFRSADYTDNLVLFTVYLGYSCLLDLALLVPSAIKLVRSSLGIRSMHKTTKLLFEHSVHYVLMVTLINLIQIIVGQADPDLENVTVAAVTAQVALTLFQLIAEQDSVNGYIGFRGEELLHFSRGAAYRSKPSPASAGRSRLRAVLGDMGRRTHAADEESPIPDLSGKEPRETSAARLGDSGSLSVPVTGMRRSTKGSYVSEQDTQGRSSLGAAGGSDSALGVSQLPYETNHNIQ